MAEQYYTNRQSAGKVDFAATQLKFGEWVGLDMIITYGTIGCNYGSSNTAPPIHGGTPAANGLTYFVSNPKGYVPNGGGFASMKARHYATEEDQPHYYHVINMYIGRSNETGEPWISPGNILQMRIQENVRNPNQWHTVGTKGLYESPFIINNEIVEITGPLNLNFDFISQVTRDIQAAPEFSLQIMLVGPDTGQQEDVYVLGDKTGYWGIEALAPVFWKPDPK